MRVFRRALAGLVIMAALVPGSYAQAPGATEPCSHQDSLGLLPPSDPAFRDAQAFRVFLTQHGFEVACVIRSTFASFLWSAPEAAFHTNRGDIEVRFFPPPDGAERVRVEEQHTSNGWRYTFPPHRAAADTMYSGPRRQYFIASRRWLILVADSTLAAHLRQALVRTGKSPEPLRRRPGAPPNMRLKLTVRALSTEVTPLRRAGRAARSLRAIRWADSDLACL